MDCVCYLRNIQVKLADKKSQNERRFGTPLDRPVILFGAELYFNPISTKNKNRLQKFGTEMRPGIFTAYELGPET